MPNFPRTSFVFLSPPSTESLKSRSTINRHYMREFFRIKRSINSKQTHCSMCDTRSVVRLPGVRRLCSAFSPTNKSLSLVNLASITRTTSPRYLPAMYFSNLRKEVTMRKIFSHMNHHVLGANCITRIFG